MANRKTTEPNVKPFKLSSKATARLNNYLAQIRQGIKNVCELHTHDSAPSLEQSDFEGLFIDRILAQTVTAVSASIRSMTDGLTAQKETEAQTLKANAETDNNPQGENKQEDNQ